MTTEKGYSDIGVCDDCMVAHHYGWDPVEEADTPEWRIGEGEQRTTIEPWNEIDPALFDVTDNTDSNAGCESEGCTDTCARCGGRIYFETGDWYHQRAEGEENLIDDRFCDDETEDGEIAERSFDTGINEFSWRRCDGCGSHLGGARYRFALWERSDT